MNVQICEQCNWPMADSFYRVCWTCYKENEGYTRLKGDDKYDELQKIIHTLLAEGTDSASNKVLEDRIRLLENSLEGLRAVNQGLLFKLAEKREVVYDDELLKKLIRFCHPDRNQDRQEEAGELTKELLDLRKKKP